MDILLWLQGWFAEQCVEDWQHFYGVKIETLDNPGWKVEIDLRGTKIESKPFQEIVKNLKSDVDWMHCKVANKMFSAACSPNHLVTVLGIFKEWAED